MFLHGEPATWAGNLGFAWGSKPAPGCDTAARAVERPIRYPSDQGSQKGCYAAITVEVIFRLQTCIERSPLHVNLIVYTELLVPGPSIDALNALLDVYDTLRSPLPWVCVSLTAAALAQYRRRGGSKQKPIPDFYIVLIRQPPCCALRYWLRHDKRFAQLSVFAATSLSPLGTARRCPCGCDKPECADAGSRPI